MSEPVKLVIKPQAEGDRYCLQKLNRIEWNVLPGTRQQVLQACQAPNASAASIAKACLNDPLLCWILSERANSLIPQREKWPHHLESLISLVGIPQVNHIVQSCRELSREQLDTHYAVLSRSIITSLLASQLFNGISVALKKDWSRQYQLSSLLYRLPEWAIAIDSPDLQLQIETLQKQGRGNPQVQQYMLGCRFSELSQDFHSQRAVLPTCRAAWQWPEHKSFAQLKSILQAFRLRCAGRPVSQSADAQSVLIACHRLVSQLWQPRRQQQNIKFLSGVSGLSRALLIRILNNSMLTMPWHDSLSIDLHPMRWQHCQWQQQHWLPDFALQKQNDTADTSTSDSPSSSPASAPKNEPLLKQCLKRLLGDQRFSSSQHLLAFTLQAFRRGLASRGAFIWVYQQGQLSCRHFYGLDEDRQPQPFKPEAVSSDICHRLLQKPAAIRINAQHPSLSPELKSLLYPQQQVAMMSILVGGKPAAVLMLIEEHSIDDEQFRLFKQLSHGFHQALLRQLQAK
ncbi:hypothetical protein [Pseudoteredinibacter isoporae]|uniref:hypothetical protein n=1 Tax=Pseudoteredinibacter isoporae TaxID=570281 RepID=UPI0031068C2F